MKNDLLRVAGPSLALIMAGTAAVASLFGATAVQRLVGSPWFLAATAVLAVPSLLAGTLALTRRSWAAACLHLGLVIGLVGVGLNQLPRRDGYLLLEPGQTGNFFLSRNLRSVQELAIEVHLDSLAMVEARGFRPAPVAWLSTGGRGYPVTYNKTLDMSGYRLMLSNVVDPGFLQEYELELGEQEYVLLHNQQVELPGGGTAWSYDFDAVRQEVQLLIGNRKVSLAPGDTVEVAGTVLKMGSATFAGQPSAILVVNDIRLRFIIYIGFGLVLLGIVPPLLRRRSA